MEGTQTFWGAQEDECPSNPEEGKKTFVALSVFPGRTPFHDTVAAENQLFIDVRVARQKLAKVAGLVQSLLVVAHARFHQHRAGLDFHLHHLAHQQVPVAQRTPPFANCRRGHVALRQKSHRRQSQILLASMRSFFFFAAAMARSISG